MDKEIYIYAKENGRTEDVCVTETDDRKSFFVSEMPGLCQLLIRS